MEKARLNSFNRMHRIYISSTGNSFTSKTSWAGLFLWVVGIAWICVFGNIRMVNDDLKLAIQVIVSLVCFIFAAILMIKSGKLSEKTQMYGFAVIDVVNKDNFGLIRKNIYLIVSRVDLSGKVPAVGFHLTKIGANIARAKREEALSKERAAIQEMMVSDAFLEKLEKSAKDEIIIDDYWYVTPMRDAEIQKNGFWGTTIKYRNAKGVFQKVFLSRDFENYDELKNIIQEWGKMP